MSASGWSEAQKQTALEELMDAAERVLTHKGEVADSVAVCEIAAQFAASLMYSALISGRIPSHLMHGAIASCANNVALDMRAMHEGRLAVDPSCTGVTVH
jgi:hypothetical protein